MNVIARLDYELAYNDSVVHRFNHYTMRTPASQIFKSFLNLLLKFVIIWTKIGQAIKLQNGTNFSETLYIYIYAM